MNRSKHIVSILLTLSIIGLLILTGPASAITVSVSASTATPNELSTVLFTIDVDSLAGERIPVNGFAFTMTPSGGTTQSCAFDIGGNIVAGTLCQRVNSVQAVRGATYTEGYGYGYGYVFGQGYDNVSFGYGYGYGYTADLTAGRLLRYVLNVSMPLVSSSTGFAYLALLNASGTLYASSSGTLLVNNTGVSDTSAPTANFTLSPTSAKIMQTVTADATLSKDNNGVARYYWRWGDSTVTNTTSVSTTHKFKTNGTFTVNLTVYDAAGNKGSRTSSIVVSLPAAKKATASAGGLANFTGDSDVNTVLRTIAGLPVGANATVSLKGTTKPAGITTAIATTVASKVLAYLQINVTSQPASGANITFVLAQSTITEEGITNLSNVKLYRYNATTDAFTELTTTVVNGTSDPAVFRAFTPGFSFFVIGVKAAAVAEDDSSGGGGGGGGGGAAATTTTATNATTTTVTPTVTPAVNVTAGANVTATSTPTGKKEASMSSAVSGALITVVVVLAILGIGYWVYTARVGRPKGGIAPPKAFGKK